jgi:hypothetical protein
MMILLDADKIAEKAETKIYSLRLGVGNTSRWEGGADLCISRWKFVGRFNDMTI